MTTTLLETLSTDDLETLRTKLATATVPEQAAIVATLAEGCRQGCVDDLDFYLRFVRTRDESDPDQSVKLFPVHKARLMELMHEFRDHSKCVVAKSRQVMASWGAVAFATWLARKRANSHVLIQTQNEEDAHKLVALAGASKDGGFEGRCQFIESHLPSWLQMHVQPSAGRIMYPNGSMIEGLPGGANKLRSKTPTLIILDEFAFLEEAKATLTAALPLVQKGAKLLILSTPNGAEGNVFYHVYSGLPITA